MARPPRMGSDPIISHRGSFILGGGLILSLCGLLAASAMGWVDLTAPESVRGNRGHEVSAMPSPDHPAVMVWTDALTGCEYLTTTAGGITPRFDHNGQTGCGPQFDTLELRK